MRPQFHFATILSPWIRRALIAGGFGTGESWSTAPREIAPVVSLHDYPSDNNNVGRNPIQTDLEASRKAQEKSSRPASIASDGDIGEGGHAPLVPSNTPFFHFDLTGAVRAAESGLARTRSPNSLGGDTKGSDREN